MKRYGWKKLAVAGFAVLCFLIIGSFKDTMKQSFLPDEMEMRSDGSLQFSVDEDEHFVAVTGGNTGVIAVTKPITHEASEYSYEIRYSSTSNKNYCEWYVASQADEDNKSEKVIAKEYLPIALEENSVYKVDIELPQWTPDLRVRFVYGGEGELRLNGLHRRSSGIYFYDTLFIIASIILLAYTCLFLKSKNLRDYDLLRLCLVVGLIGTLPLLSDRLPDGHDLSFHLTRIEGIRHGLQSGIFPVRINPVFANGYGYAEPIMYPNLLLYIPAIFRICRVSMLASYGMFIFLVNCATFFVCYYSVKRFTQNNLIAVMASFFYTLGLYRLVNIYTRAALGETLGMMFLPLILLGMYEILWGEEKRYWALVWGATGIISSHILTAEMTVIFCAVFVLISIGRFREKRRILALFKALGMIALLNLWFLLPFLDFSRMKFKIFSSENQPSLYSVRIPQLIETFDTNTHTMPLSLGLLLVLGLVLYAAIRKAVSAEARLAKVADCSFLFACLAIFMASVYCPWGGIEQIPVLGKVLSAVQFPWRYLGLGTVFAGVVTSVGLYTLLRHSVNRQMMCFIGALAAILNVMPYLDNYCQTQGALLGSKFDSYSFNNLYGGQYYYEGTDEGELLMQPAILSSIRDLGVDNYHKDGIEMRFNYSAEEIGKGDYIAVPLYYYPAFYHVFIDGKKVRPYGDEDNNFRLAFEVPAGADSGEVSIKYREPWYYRAAELLSVITLILIRMDRKRTFCRRIGTLRKRSADSIDSPC